MSNTWTTQRLKKRIEIKFIQEISVANVALESVTKVWIGDEQEIKFKSHLINENQILLITFPKNQKLLI